MITGMYSILLAKNYIWIMTVLNKTKIEELKMER